MKWNWTKQTPKSEEEVKQPASTIDDVSKGIEAVVDAIDDLQHKVSPEKAKVSDAIKRHNAGLLPTIKPTILSPEDYAAEDHKAEIAQRAANENSQSRQKQNGESEIEYQHRLHKMAEYEITKNMSGAQAQQRAEVLAKLTAEDKLRSKPYPTATVVEAYNGSIVLKLDPHPLCPRKLMINDTLTVKQALELYVDAEGESRLSQVEVEIGDVGTLRSQSTDGITVNWYFIVDAA